jgi:hypothetical protein
MVGELMRAMKLLFTIGVVATCLAAGCGGGSDTPPPTGTVDAGPPMTTTGPYQPLTVGSTWTYKVDDQGFKYDKTSTVESVEDMGGAKAGTTAYRVSENVKAARQLTWYEQSGTEVRRHHDQFFDDQNRMLSDEWYSPFMLRVDEAPAHTQQGATWSIDFVNTKTTSSKPTAMLNHTETWVVDGVDVVVGVPAGSFYALQVTRTDAGDGAVKTMWFVKGVGKVKELTNAGHLEELSSYNIAP